MQQSGIAKSVAVLFFSIVVLLWGTGCSKVGFNSQEPTSFLGKTGGEVGSNNNVCDLDDLDCSNGGNSPIGQVKAYCGDAFKNGLPDGSDLPKTLLNLENLHCTFPQQTSSRDISTDYSQDTSGWDFSIDCAWDTDGVDYDKSYDFSADCSLDKDGNLSSMDCSCDSSYDQSGSVGAVDISWDYDFSCTKVGQARWNCISD